MNGHTAIFGMTIVIIGLVFLLPAATVSVFDSVTGGAITEVGEIPQDTPEAGMILKLSYATVFVGFAVVLISFFMNPRKPSRM